MRGTPEGSSAGGRLETRSASNHRPTLGRPRRMMAATAMSWAPCHHITRRGQLPGRASHVASRSSAGSQLAATGPRPGESERVSRGCSLTKVLLSPASQARHNKGCGDHGLRLCCAHKADAATLLTRSHHKRSCVRITTASPHSPHSSALILSHPSES